MKTLPELIAERDALNEQITDFDLSLEERYARARGRAGGLIAAELTNAGAALDRAKELADKYGVPFSSDVVNATDSSWTYYPESYEKLWKEVPGFYFPDYTREGWETSTMNC